MLLMAGRDPDTGIIPHVEYTVFPTIGNIKLIIVDPYWDNGSGACWHWFTPRRSNSQVSEVKGRIGTLYLNIVEV